MEPDIGHEALRLLARREHSGQELKHKLRARGYAEADIEQLIEALAERGLVSDRRMVETYVAERIRKGFGPLRIRHELHRRGLADDLIDGYLESAVQDWWNTMAAVYAKKFGPVPANDRKAHTQQARFLEYRGFPAELIADFLNGKDPF